MGRMKCIFPLLSLILFATISSARAIPAQILIIRHAEKPSQGIGLSPRGWQRANALPKFLIGNPDFETPNVLFAMAQKNSTGSIRAILTVTPLSTRLSLPLTLGYTREEYPAAAADILENPAFNGKVVLICWEHHVIPDFAGRLGVKEAPTDWEDPVYDRIWVIDYAKGQVSRFRNLPQRLLAGDSPQ